MSERNFRQLLETHWSRGNFVCIGLDSDVWKIPIEHIPYSKYLDAGQIQIIFNRMIVEATRDLVCAYKPNSAFYEARGAEGIEALRRTIADIHALAPEIPVILDAKRADIDNTNAGYIDAAFGFFRADAITVHPYLGAQALQPFLARAEKGVIVLCRTSNPGAGEFQDLKVSYQSRNVPMCTHIVPLYQYVAKRVAEEWNKNGNCALVVGATYPDELREVRGLVGDMPILIPGIGAQGGDVEKTVSAGKDSRGQGIIVNSSCGIIFASNGADFAEAARRETEKLRDLINQYREKGDHNEV